MSAPKHTPLYAAHQSLNAKLVDFGGWALPVNYGSQIEEHHAVRNQCGMFDVSHMTVWDISGSQAKDYLSYLLANDINKLSNKPGKALYSCLLNPAGGVIDDLIVYHLSTTQFRMVTNASTRDKVNDWLLAQQENFTVDVSERPDLALIAVQGPSARDTVQTSLPSELANLCSQLKRFEGGFAGDCFVGRTGYTGEDGVELIIPADQAESIWQLLFKAGVQPCGLGARDTLRLEAGMALYGNDLDEQHTPLESGLKWTVSLGDDRQFIGKASLLENSSNTMIGLELVDKGVLRSHQEIYLGDRRIGEVTSGTFSPSLEKSIGLARIDTQLDVGTRLEIAVRKRRLSATVVRYPFYPANGS